MIEPRPARDHERWTDLDRKLALEGDHKGVPVAKTAAVLQRTPEAVLKEVERFKAAMAAYWGRS